MVMRDRKLVRKEVGELSILVCLERMPIEISPLYQKVESSVFPWTPVIETRVDCSKLFSGDEAELERANSVVPAQAVSAKVIASTAATCPTFKEKFGFITSPLRDEERDFPIAYSILTFKDAEQVRGAC